MSARPGLSAALAATILVSCQSIAGTTARVAWLQTNVRGDVALGPSGGGASLGDRKVDVEDELGIDAPNDSVLLAAALPTPFGRLGASSFWLEQDGGGRLGSPFGDIAAGSQVATELSFLNVKGYWVYDVVDTPVVRLAPGVALQFIDLELEVVDRSGGTQREDAEFFVPIPLLFLDGDVQVGPLNVSAQGGGMSAHVGDGGGIHWDFEGRVSFVPAESVEVFAGYRLLTIDARGTAGSRDADLDLRIDGWFVGGGFRF